MPSRWTTSLAKYLPRATQGTVATNIRPGPSSLLRAQPHVERLEDRTTPSVTATQNGSGVLTVTFSAASDSGTIEGTAASGTAISVTDNVASTTQTFTGVTAINVISSALSAAAERMLTFDDAGAGTDIDITGAISVSDIETVNVETADGALHAAAFSVTSATKAINLEADVTTTGTAGQAYGGPVFIGSATVSGVTLNTGTSGAVTFSGTVDSSSGNSNSLTVDAGGLTRFTGTVGGTTALASLAAAGTGSTDLGASVTTAGTQSYDGPVTVSGTDIATTSSSGDISFESTIDGTSSGTNSLTVGTSGQTTFAGAVGGSNALESLLVETQGTTSLVSTVQTTGNQTYNNPVTLSGTAVTLTSTSSGAILFDSTINSEISGANDLTVNTTGLITFVGSIGGTSPIAAVTTDAVATDAGGTTTIGNGSAAVTIKTSGAQDFNDPVTVDASSSANITFQSSSSGAITFASTLNTATAGTNGIVVSTGGVATFGGKVGNSAAPTTLETDDNGGSKGKTVVENTVTTSGALTFSEPVTITPGTSVTAVTVTSTAGTVSFSDTIAESTDIPLSIIASGDISTGGNVTLSESGSALTVHAGTSGTGEVSIASGVTVDADTQIWQAGDGTGGQGTSSTVNLVTNSPTFLAASGSGAPQTFVLRQDAAVTDSTIPTPTQFGGSTPANETIISDDEGVTLNSATVADAGTTSLTLSAQLGLSLGEKIDAPLAVVRLQAFQATVTETASAGITALALGVRGSTGIDLSTGGTGGGNTINGTFAAETPTGNIEFNSAGAVIVGSIAADAAPGIFTATAGVTATSGTVAFTQPGTTPLNLTIDAQVAGTTVTATGTTGSDQVTVNYTVGGALTDGLTFTGGGAGDTLALSDAGSTSAHRYLIKGTVTHDSDKPIVYTNIGTVSITGGTAADTFNVTPDANAAYSLSGGGDTTSSTTGDALTIALTGATAPDLTESPESGGLSGKATFGNFKTVSFSQMTTVSPSADIQVTATGPTNVAQGGTETLTIVVTNAGTITANGVTVNVPVPNGVTASWTAVTSSGSTVAATSGTGAINTTATLAASGTATFTLTETLTPTTTGTLSTVASVGQATNAFDPNAANNSATVSTTVTVLDLIAVGAGAGGGPQVKVYNPDGSLRLNFYAYDPSYQGGVTVATGDISGDGVPDIVTGSAEGSSNVKVFNGDTGAQIASFFAFPGFTGGVNVAVVNGEVVVGAGPGGGPIVAGFTVENGVATQVFSFFAFDASFRGGSTVGGSGTDLAVGAGQGGGPNVKVFELPSLTQVASFYAFPVGTTGGVSVAVGTSGGEPSVVVGAGPGSTPVVNTYTISTITLSDSVLAYAQSFAGGVQVATGDTTTGEPTTIFGAGPGGSPRVRVVGADNTTILDFYAFDPSFTGGVYVG